MSIEDREWYREEFKQKQYKSVADFLNDQRMASIKRKALKRKILRAILVISCTVIALALVLLKFVNWRIF